MNLPAKWRDQLVAAGGGRFQYGRAVIQLEGKLTRTLTFGGGSGAAIEPPPPRSTKRALLVGIKYSRGRRLDGPVNDVRFMKMLLTDKFKFPPDSILVLTDDEDERDPAMRPTMANIRRGMRWLVEGCTSGDSLVFHFSGHGGKVIIQERVYKTICALDGEIKDDEINRTIVGPLVNGVTLHAIVDSCHSDTILDLANICTIRRSGRHEWEDYKRRGTRGGRAILISGGSDRQDAYEYGSYGGLVLGALTTAIFAAAMTEPRPLTYGRLLAAVKVNVHDIRGGRGRMPTDVTMVNNYSGVLAPQMPSSDQFDINRTNFTL
uniref:Uncharacterized protein n=1 Tax=Avena sativa TaxID=4498 RepID=A0ACD5Y9U8_AVESA